jgi:hypothetical protein
MQLDKNGLPYGPARGLPCQRPIKAESRIGFWDLSSISRALESVWSASMKLNRYEGRKGVQKACGEKEVEQGPDAEAGS